MIKIRIRVARQDEASSVKKLVTASIPHDERWAIFDGLVAGALSDDKTVSELILVAVDGRRRVVASALRSRTRRPRRCSAQASKARHSLRQWQVLVKLSAVAVDAEYRDAGIGSKLVRRLLAEFRAREYLVMYGQMDSANAGLLSFYTRLGFDALDAGQPLELPFGRWPAMPGERWFSQHL